MKKLLVIVVALFLVSSVSYAQSVKYGSVKVEEIMALMPEADSVRIKLTEYAGKLQGELELMQSELQKKAEAYQKDQAQYSAVMRQQKEKDIREGQASIQQYQQIAQEELQQKQNEYMAPIFKKINDAIKKVSDANNISFVIDASQPAFIYHNESLVEDITDKIKVALSL